MDQKPLITSSIAACKAKLNTLQQNTSLLWFQDFCKGLVDLIQLYTKYSSSFKQENAFCSSVLLHIMHLKEYLTLLIEIFTTEESNNITLTEARNFANKQLNWCLDGLLQDLDDPCEINEQDESFVCFMDLALEKLLEFDFNGPREGVVNVLNEFRAIVEEILSHAMSVAQIAAEEYNAIKGSCQAVLEGVDSLEKEIEKNLWQPTLCNLFVDVCNDKLCILERRINITVLKLCLSTFSDYKSGLERLHAYCLAENEKTESEIDNLVAEFDLFVDKLMQIGFFAVACSTNTSRVTQIKNCLVSLEALEVELVPALTAVALDKSLGSSQYAVILKNFWLRQAKTLQDAVYFIIDPTAFSNVIYEEIKNNIDEIQTEHVLTKTRILIDFFRNSSEEMTEEELRRIKPKFEKVKIAFHELKSANVLLQDEKRVLKRCKILLNMVKQLWLSTNEENATKNIAKNLEQIVQHVGNPLIDHCIERAQEILKERSFLKPASATKNKNFFAIKKKETPLLKVVLQKRTNFAILQTKNENSFNRTITSIIQDMSYMTKNLDYSER